jgi:hypothetical protein
VDKDIIKSRKSWDSNRDPEGNMDQAHLESSGKYEITLKPVHIANMDLGIGDVNGIVELLPKSIYQ